MSVFKSFATRIGSYNVETLDMKAQPERIPSQKELDQEAREKLKMQELHEWVMQWVQENLDEADQSQFYTALGDHRYGDAHAVLDSAFFSNGSVTFRQRSRFRRWRANFDNGFLTNS